MPASTTVLESIGDTPLVQLRRLVPPSCARVVVKLEGANPTGNMKDRMAKTAMEAAVRDGRLRPGGVVVEYTGGSTGASLALVCAVRGFRCKIVTSDAFSAEKTRTARAFGAEIVLIRSDAGRITQGLISRMIDSARQLSLEPEHWWFDPISMGCAEPAESAVLSGRAKGSHRIEGIGIGFHSACLAAGGRQ